VQHPESRRDDSTAQPSLRDSLWARAILPAINGWAIISVSRWDTPPRRYQDVGKPEGMTAGLRRAALIKDLAMSHQPLQISGLASPISGTNDLDA